jgi:hypothetical protein
VAVPIIGGAFLVITEDLIGLIDLLETGVGIGGPVPIGMVLKGEPPERLFHVLV